MPPVSSNLPPQQKKKPVAIILLSLAVIVLFAAVLIFSIMKRNPLKQTLLPEPSQNSLTANETGNTSNAIMNQGVTIDRVDVMIMESFPVQVRALVRGNLVDGCTTIVNSSSRKEGNTFFIDLETVRQGDMCTQALVPFEKSVSLDVLGLKAGTYTVSVAGFATSFTLDQDNQADFDSAQK